MRADSSDTPWTLLQLMAVAFQKQTEEGGVGTLKVDEVYGQRS